MSTDRIEKQTDLAAPVSRVWRALTDHREFSQWFRALVEFRLEKSDNLPASRRDEAFRMNDGGWTSQIGNLTSHVGG